MLHPTNFFDLSKSKHSEIFRGVELVWDALSLIPEYIKANLKTSINGTISPLAYLDDNVYIGSGTVVEPGVVIKGPTIIGANCEVRAGAYIRGNVLVGDRVVVGHTTELKTCILFDQAEVPHFSYVGDSILGWKAHLGAGVKISNLKVTRTPVAVKVNNQRYETGLLKFGAILGDEVEVGCNSVLNPGTLVGKQTLVYANLSLLGYYPPNSIIKLHQSYEILERRSEN